MGSNPITIELVKKVLRKLDAQDVSTKNDVHPRFAIFHNGQIVAVTGTRRSSKRDMALPHVKRDLRVNEYFLKGLAACPISRDEWLREIGVLDDENADEDAETREPDPDQGSPGEP